MTKGVPMARVKLVPTERLDPALRDLTEERKNSKSPFAATNLSPFPLPRATIAPPEGEVKRPARAMPLAGAQKGGEPARPLPSLRSKPGAARARTEAVGRGQREVRSRRAEGIR